MVIKGRQRRERARARACEKEDELDESSGTTTAQQGLSDQLKYYMTNINYI